MIPQPQYPLVSATADGFFDPSGGGDPALFQHILWFFGHPELYIGLFQGLIVLAGIIWVSRWLISRKNFRVFFLLLFCVTLLVFASAISIKYIHGLFTRGEPLDLTWHRIPFQAFHAIFWLTILGFVVTVMSKAKAIAKAVCANPVSGLFLLSAFFAFGFAWVSTVWLVDRSIDSYLHDTYSISSHVKQCSYLILVNLFFALVFATWFKVLKSNYKRAFGLVFWFIFSVSVILIFLPYLETFKPIQDPSRLVPDFDYQQEAASVPLSIKIGIAGLTLSSLLFVYLIFDSLRKTR